VSRFVKFGASVICLLLCPSRFGVRSWWCLCLVFVVKMSKEDEVAELKAKLAHTTEELENAQTLGDVDREERERERAEKSESEQDESK